MWLGWLTCEWSYNFCPPGNWTDRTTRICSTFGTTARDPANVNRVHDCSQLSTAKFVTSINARTLRGSVPAYGERARLRTTLKRPRESHTPLPHKVRCTTATSQQMACAAVELPFFKGELPSFNRQRAHLVASTWASQGLVTSSESAVGRLWVLSWFRVLCRVLVHFKV